MPQAPNGQAAVADRERSVARRKKVPQIRYTEAVDFPIRSETFTAENAQAGHATSAVSGIGDIVATTVLDMPHYRGRKEFARLPELDLEASLRQISPHRRRTDRRTTLREQKMSVDWDSFVNVIHEHQNILLTSHIRPDCDALGSELGMAGVLDKLGKNVRIVNGQQTPQNLAFIDPQQRLRTIGDDVQMPDLADVDLVMVLDTSAWAQLGPMGEVVKATSAKKIIFDHHVGEDDLGADLYKDRTAPATGCMVVTAAERLGVALTPEIASPLFAAVATDTGWYRYGSVTSDTYQVAAKLTAAGASPAEIYSHLYERDTVGRVRLRGLILSRTQTELDGRLAHTFVRAEDFEQTGALPTDTEDVINLTLGIAGTEAAVILVEQLTGGFKLSFRSRCSMDCSEVAGDFGGGGHKAAAGAFIDEPLEAAREKVLAAVRAKMV